MRYTKQEIYRVRNNGTGYRGVCMFVLRRCVFCGKVTVKYTGLQTVWRLLQFHNNTNTNSNNNIATNNNNNLTVFLFQRLSTALQRGNAVSFHALSPTSKRHCGLTCLFLNISYIRELSTKGLKNNNNNF